MGGVRGAATAAAAAVAAVQVLAQVTLVKNAVQRCSSVLPILRLQLQQLLGCVC